MQLLLLVSVLVCSLANGAPPPDNQCKRPFAVLVRSIKTLSAKRQYEYVKKLSRGLQSDDMAGIRNEYNVPHFGHLVDELHRQEMDNVLRELMKKAEISPDHYHTIAKVLSQELDDDTFVILMKNSTPGAKSSYQRILDREKHIGRSVVEDIPEYSAVMLGTYLKSDKYSKKAHLHLVNILKTHPSPNVRGFATAALGQSPRKETITDLKKALKDKASLDLLQGFGNETVSAWAQKAIESIQNNQSGKKMDRKKARLD
ncbi:MAG: HEAT repeat domain-containing protein [Pirellulales bacterium]|nr:HEAT repeat domain-containing protein [Pirellulales bacterium]